MPVPTNTSTSRSPLSHPVTRATQIVTTRPSASATTHASTRSGRATASVRGASADGPGALAGRAALGADAARGAAPGAGRDGRTEVDSECGASDGRTCRDDAITDGRNWLGTFSG